MKCRKTLTKVIAFLTVITLCFTSSQIAYAAESVNWYYEPIESAPIYNAVSEEQKLYNGMTEAELERKIYMSLSPEAKALYDSVDTNGRVNIQRSNIRAATPVSSSYTQLIKDLTALGLPTAVFNSLKAAAASLASAAVDGPLPVGDILAVFSTVTLVAVVAVNWNEVAPKWNKIVAAFKKAFSNSTKNMSTAFSTTKTQVGEQTKKTPSITVDGKTVTVNTVKYQCAIRADKIAKKKYSGNNYYIAVLYSGWVWVCTNKQITISEAKIVQRGNNNNVGVWATLESGAINLCQPKPRGPEIHGGGKPGYFYHYHLDYAYADKCHVWFSKP